MKRFFISFTIVIALFLQPVSSQVLNSHKLDSLFNILAEKNKAMGSVAISKEGKLIYSKAIGYSFVSDKEKKPSTILTRYRIGSISKMFTATMIFQLMEEGKITLNSTLNTWYPQIPNAEKITIGQMLNHHSGIHSFTDDPEYMTWMTSPKTEKELVEIICAKKAEFQPGEKGAYSNSNFYLLSCIIEKITGKSYPENLKNRITSKIGLKNTYYGGKTNLAGNECYSYEFDQTWKQQPETDMSIPSGAGALVSTPSDLVRFIEALFSLKLVSEKSLAQMKTLTDGIGMGMFQFPFNEKKAFGHNGGIDGFVSNLAYFPEDKVAVSYCSNGMVYPMNDILIGILSIYFNRDYKLPTFNTLSLKAEELDKYTGVYSSTQLPLKITITKDGTVLKGQATGQPPFPLEATAPDTFKFEKAGLRMEFEPDKNQMTLFQGGGTFIFTKEK
jgi:D-alanyl-D-alanine carboxypeptidase